MARNNFFSNTPELSTKALNASTGEKQSTSPPNNRTEQEMKRVTYSIKIAPDIRREIKEWAKKNDVTISSVIETLAKLYLHNLDPDDIQ